MKNENVKPESHKEKLAKLLIELRPNVSKEDRKDAQKKFRCTRATVSRYLNGTVHDINTGTNLYTYFKKLIDKREKALA